MKKSEKELKKYEMKIYNTANNVEEKLRPKFKALAYISDQLADVSKRHDDEMLLLQNECDVKDKPLYELRKLIIQGLDFDASTLNPDDFDHRLEQIKDEDYEKIKIEESKNVQNLDGQKGIPDFWLIAMKNNRILSKDINKDDQKLLKHLVDIEYQKVDGSSDFLLKFYFTPNDYIHNTVITKTYHMDDSDTCRKVDCTQVRWRDKMNLLENEPAKKNKGKKKKKAVEKVDSFFEFFTSKEGIVGDPNEEDLNEEDEERLDIIEDDYMFAQEFRDELIPLGLEYYLNIVEEDFEGEGEDIEDNNEAGGEKVTDGKAHKSADKNADIADDQSDNSKDD